MRSVQDEMGMRIFQRKGNNSCLRVEGAYCHEIELRIKILLTDDEVTGIITIGIHVIIVFLFHGVYLLHCFIPDLCHHHGDKFNLYHKYETHQQQKQYSFAILAKLYTNQEIFAVLTYWGFITPGSWSVRTGGLFQAGGSQHATPGTYLERSCEYHTPYLGGWFSMYSSQCVAGRVL